jgi:hypothetical protein
MSGKHKFSGCIGCMSDAFIVKVIQKEAWEIQAGQVIGSSKHLIISIEISSWKKEEITSYVCPPLT